MKLEKIINYELNKTELENKIKEIESIYYKNRTELQRNLLRKYKSELDEYQILKFLDEHKNIKAIKYINDLTNQAIRTFEDFEQNTLNCVGTDLIVKTTKDKFLKIDMKVLEYYSIHYKTKRKYNGDIKDNNWGMENFIFQVEGKCAQLGWSNNRYKQSDLLMIYIKKTNKIYTFKYKKLVKFINNKINNKEITEKDYIIFEKGYGATKTRECVVSIPCSDIPKDIVHIHNII